MEYEYVTRNDNISSQYIAGDYIFGNTVKAKYVKSLIPADQGNPFIEALPRPREGKNEIFQAYNKEIRISIGSVLEKMPKYYKISEINLLRKLRFPLPFHKELEQQTYMALLNSYRNRYYKEAEEAKDSCLIGSEGSATNAGFSLLGYSGCGKSSAVEILFSNYPQVIIHNSDSVNKFTQIVYLVVSCVANSNFSALYDSLGGAIDRALGITNGIYAKYVSAGRNLGQKSARVKNLIERFGIGIIVFDEIQLIDFDSTRENSFEGLMTLANQTKVAIAAVGTEDAYEKMFNGKLRTARRLGAAIIGHQYCSNMDYFRFLVNQLFKYQWTQQLVIPTDDIVKCLYEYTKGIIDQLIGLYVFMQIDCVNAAKEPTINTGFIKKVVNKHYPGIQQLLQNLEDPLMEIKRAELIHESNRKIDDLLEEEKQKMNAAEIIKYMDDKNNQEKLRIRTQLMEELTDFFEDMSIDEIMEAVDYELKLKVNGDVDISTLRKRVIKHIKKLHNPEEKQQSKIRIDMRNEILGK